MSKLNELTEKYICCELTKNEEDIKELLCDTVLYIMEKGWIFLLEINAWRDKEELIVGGIEDEDGFFDLYYIPLCEIRNRSINLSKVNAPCLEMCILWISNMIPRIPKYE